MTNVQPATAPMRFRDREFWWWLVQIVFAPLGMFGGALSLASMCQQFIKWGGLLGYLVHFWTENVSVQFAFIFGWLTTLFGLPPLPWWLADYLIFGILLASRYFLAWKIAKAPQFPGDLPRWVKFLRHLFLWPYSIFDTLRWVHRKGVQSWAGLLLTFGPILIFLALWLANLVYA